MESIKNVLNNCPGMDQLVEDLGTTIAEVTSGIGDIIEVTKILINGIDIFDDTRNCINDWRARNYIGFGENIAQIVLKLA